MARKAPAPAVNSSKVAAAADAQVNPLAETRSAPTGTAGTSETPGSRPVAKAGAGGARDSLLERAALNSEGGYLSRSDPLADAKAARAVAGFLESHAKEMSRRGLDKQATAAALQLAQELEEHLQALPAAAVSARGRTQEAAELLADAAGAAHAVRDAVLRVTRGPGGRKVAHAFGLGEPFNVRQQAHVVRALQRILAAAKLHPDTVADIGLVPDDLQTMKGLADDLAGPDASPRADDHRQLTQAQGALRAWFDLVAAKGLLAFAGDPDERARLLRLIPRAEERRQHRRQES